MPAFLTHPRNRPVKSPCPAHQLLACIRQYIISSRSPASCATIHPGGQKVPSPIFSGTSSPAALMHGLSQESHGFKAPALPGAVRYFLSTQASMMAPSRASSTPQIEQTNPIYTISSRTNPLCRRRNLATWIHPEAKTNPIRPYWQSPSHFSRANRPIPRERASVCHFGRRPGPRLRSKGSCSAAGACNVTNAAFLKISRQQSERPTRRYLTSALRYRPILTSTPQMRSNREPSLPPNVTARPRFPRHRSAAGASPRELPSGSPASPTIEEGPVPRPESAAPVCPGRGNHSGSSDHEG